MRIISDFHDYYDVGMGTGPGRSLIYRRFPHKVEASGEYRLPWAGVHGGGHFISFYAQRRLNVRTTVVGFCGKIHHVVEVSPLRWHQNGTRLMTDPEAAALTRCCFNIGEVDEWVERLVPRERDRAGYFHNRKDIRKNESWQPNHLRETFEAFLAEGEREQDRYGHLFEKAHSPVFTTVTEGRSPYLVFDSPLKDWQFFRRFDPYQAFQEISMFLGAMAEPGKSIPTMDDETKLALHGFDGSSFRKGRTSPKRK